MVKEYKDKIEASGVEITVLSTGNEDDYISLTDIAKKRTVENPGYVIQNWMRNRSTVAFLGLWEKMYNPEFNCLEFEAIESEAGLNSFVLTPKRWVENTNAIKENLIPLNISQKQKGITYANEADVLNVALFGMTAKEWRTKYPEKAQKGNIRDDATLEQLII